jgi:hypothetical protein
VVKTIEEGNIPQPQPTWPFEQYINAKEKYFIREVPTINHWKMTFHAL